MIDELYEDIMMKLKDMLKQSNSVSLQYTTDAAKMPTGDSYVAITGHWINSDCTLKLINDVVTRWDSTYYMLARCVLLAVPLRKLIEELGLKGLPTMTGQLLSCCATP